MTVFQTQTEYAAHRNICQSRVSRLVSKGKIPKSCIKIISGRKLIDRDKADEALGENLDRIYNRPKTDKSKPKKKTKPEDQVKVLREAGVEIRTLADAQTIKENYNAYLKELEYKIKMKELISAADAEMAMTHIVVTARGKILGIKSKLAPLLKEFVADPVNFGTLLETIDDTVREILQDIADASAIKNNQ